MGAMNEPVKMEAINPANTVLCVCFQQDAGTATRALNTPHDKKALTRGKSGAINADNI
jgi:hypothetical protein